MSKKNIILLICSIIFLIIAIIVFVFATSKNSTDNTSNTTAPITSSQLNDKKFKFSDKEGNSYSLDDFNDKPIALILWSSDAENALETLEVAIETFEKSDVKDSINLLIINTNEPNDDIKDIVEKCNFSVPVYYDSNSTAYNEYYFSKLPYLVFIKADGTISNELNPNETEKKLTSDSFEANLELLVFEEEN